jgi:pectinesterase
VNPLPPAIACAGLLLAGGTGCVVRHWDSAAEVAMSRPAERADAVVAQDGTGDFTTIQAALDSLPEASVQLRIVLVRNGTYREKLFVTKGHVALVGEDRERTRIVFSELRSEWRKTHPDDWGAAVVNLGEGASDFVLAHVTVYNDFGNLNGNHDHQFAIRSGAGATRLSLLHASLRADGGDTVSLWNGPSGMYYHADCFFEGWVDYLCPRGLCYVTTSRFFGHNENASIWHDGSFDEGQKLVIRDSVFDGVPGFALGRNTRDGQFFLVNCRFAASMADRAIYLAKGPAPFRWGLRAYYSGCTRDGENYGWYRDNLRDAAGSPRAEDIDARWTFGKKWDPEETARRVDQRRAEAISATIARAAAAGSCAPVIGRPTTRRSAPSRIASAGFATRF